jgi:hypothetical protein
MAHRARPTTKTLKKVIMAHFPRPGNADDIEHDEENDEREHAPKPACDDMEIGREPEHARDDMEIGREPEHVRDDMEIGREPEHVRDDMEIGREPEHARDDMEIGRELEHVRDNMEIGREPEHARDEENYIHREPEHYQNEGTSGVPIDDDEMQHESESIRKEGVSGEYFYSLNNELSYADPARYP